VTGVRVFVCDNYDSFTFNLVQYLGELRADVTVARNDERTIDDIDALAPDAVVISPGPGTPSSAGISVAIAEWCAQTRTPLLGVCLGLQAIGAAFGVPTIRADRVMHGKSSLVHHDGGGVFDGLPSPLEAGRYHSLVLDATLIAPELHVSAWTDDRTTMGIRHVSLPIEGVQFHPESVLTPNGIGIVRTFVRNAKPGRRTAKSGQALPI
jgi:anthranilate synthase/aminodeoxychorismate synthase-like glutamine amidotransferase